MDSSNSRSSLPTRLDRDVGALLRHWRNARRLSQLALALDADISSHHLSYVETGRSQLSREMVLRLADALEIPLRERNLLLVAAGYAPRYFEIDLGAPEMARMRNAIDLILRHQLSKDLLAEVLAYPGSPSVADTRARRGNDAAPDHHLPKRRRRASVFLDLHEIRNAARRDARRAAHRVLVSGKRSDGQCMPRTVRPLNQLRGGFVVTTRSRMSDLFMRSI